MCVHKRLVALTALLVLSDNLLSHQCASSSMRAPSSMEILCATPASAPECNRNKCLCYTLASITMDLYIYISLICRGQKYTSNRGNYGRDFRLYGGGIKRSPHYIYIYICTKTLSLHTDPRTYSPSCGTSGCCDECGTSIGAAFTQRTASPWLGSRALITMGHFLITRGFFNLR